MERRKFIKLGVLSGSVSAALFGGYLWVYPSFKQLIIRILEKDLDGLKVKSFDIERFAEDASKLNPWDFNTAKIYFIALCTKFGFVNLPYMYKFHQYRADIVARFLLSTDFFRNGMKEDVDIQYGGVVYTPYRQPCGNPFSHLYYPA
jgi:hypothetical protein